jgi:hypothetical protein
MCAQILLEVPDEAKFKIWYLDSIKVLRDRKDGHGAISALMIVFPLYERLYRFAVHNGTPDNRPEWVKNDLGLDSKEDAKIFWNVLRDGLCHAGSFFEESDIYDRDELPRISISGSFNHPPKLVRSNSSFVLEINPWKFCDHVLKRYESNAPLLSFSKAPLLSLHVLIDDGK